MPRAPLKFSVLRGVRPLLAPAAILLAAVLALAAGPSLPPSLSGLKTLGPYVVLLLGIGMGVRFNRGRAFKHWPEVFNNDSTLPSPLLDRLLHHAETVIIEGKSFRAKDQINS